jgi:hypothetical protein
MYSIKIEEGRHIVYKGEERLRPASSIELYFWTLAFRTLTGSEALFGLFGVLIGENVQVLAMRTDEEKEDIMKMVVHFCQDNELVPPRENFDTMLRWGGKSVVGDDNERAPVHPDLEKIDEHNTSDGV